MPPARRAHEKKTARDDPRVSTVPEATIHPRTLALLLYPGSGETQWAVVDSRMRIKSLAHRGKGGNRVLEKEREKENRTGTRIYFEFNVL